jgi:hypothetical protein
MFFRRRPKLPLGSTLATAEEDAADTIRRVLEAVDAEVVEMQARARRKANGITPPPQIVGY